MNESRDDRLLSVQEAAEFLRCNPETLRRWARQRRVPASKLGDRWVFRLQRLQEWLDAGGMIQEGSVTR